MATNGMMKPSRTITVSGGVLMCALLALSLGVHFWTLYDTGRISRFILMPVFGGFLPAMALIAFLSKSVLAAIDGGGVPRQSVRREWLNIRGPVTLCPVWLQRLLLILAVYGIVQFVVMIFHANSVADANGIVPGYVINRPVSATMAALYAYAVGTAWTAFRFQTSASLITK